ncbi:biotin-dependent carboxyltransferase family protein [Amycolatopsis magusensis]|uniref:5-oxoprolinase subunit C family protein n=1 Tax=Amycolatopsis magusensis TaxID=882444 RepID=UPI0024A9D06C|nr:biotin-dependent carboxyltransferase family protein [Amycolatopsis magusensis]MDI5980345.1 biotin-dependent carboxyltransferase family protein [Amycolatopsis magusensis]
MTAKLEVLTPGLFATVQDLGRPGYTALGVGRSGAADRDALRLANRLVGNPEGNAAVEATFGGLAVRFDGPTLIALTGAVGPARLGGRAIGPNAPVFVGAGEELRLGAPDRGLRTYLAVRGGIEVPPVLGGRGTDTLSGLGPAPLAAGTTLPVGHRVLAWPVVDQAPCAAIPDEPVLRLVPGPRLDFFTEDALGTLLSGRYAVSAQSNRVGLRLDGPVLRRAKSGEVPSEPAAPGAVQVPPSGQPILFLADHPVTGGYPVVAVVAEEDLGGAAQARPGTRLRFVRSRLPG